jgi:anti-sigma B factor antagonist
MNIMQTQQAFSIEVHVFDQGRILSLHGYLDASTSNILDQEIQKTLADAIHKIIIDCTELTYISSAGLGIFMKHIDTIRKQGGDLVFCSMQKSVFTVFDLLGFPILYRIVDSKESALSLFEVGGES